MGAVGAERHRQLLKGEGHPAVGGSSGRTHGAFSASEIEQVARFAVVLHRHVGVDARRGDAGVPGSVPDFRQRPTAR